MVQVNEILEPLSALWWQSLIWVTVIVSAILIVSKYLQRNQIEILAKVIGVVLITRTITVQFYVDYLVGWTIHNNLPLHICGLASIISGIIMFFRRQWLYECLYFWGIPGAFHALVTPQFTQGRDGLLFIEYYISHGGIILSALFCTMYLGLAPRPGSWWRIFLYSQLLIPLVGGINWLLESNYMYICEPPIVNNPFIIGDFPEHLIGMEFAALLHFAIVYLPFGLKYHLAQKSSNPAAA